MTTEKSRMTREFIQTLPVLSFKVNGELCRGYYDTVVKRVYLIDNEGNLTNKYAQANLDVKLAEQLREAENIPDQQTPPEGEQNTVSAETPEQAQPADKAESAVPVSAGNSPVPVDLNIPKLPQKITVAEPELTQQAEHPEDQESDPPKRKKKKIFILIALVVGTILLVWISGAVGIILEHNASKQPPAETTAPQQTVPPLTSTEPIQSEPETTAPNDLPDDPSKGIFVLLAKDTLLPGHVISQSDFELVEVTETEYRALGTAGGIYTSDNLAVLEGMSIIEYVSSGKYLSYADVGTTYSPLNPWSGMGDVIVALPLQLIPGDFGNTLWGNTVTLEIEVQSKFTSSVGGDGEETTYPPGIDHDSSTVESTIIDKYIIRDAIITDALDQNQDSLFIRYKSLSSIPVVFLRDILETEYENKDQIRMDIPCFIKVGVSADQGVLLQQILSSDYQSLTVRIVSTRLNVTSEMQNTTYTATQEVSKVIADIWYVYDQEE